MHAHSERIVLRCEGCGEELLIVGPEEDWRSREAVFKCGCGRKLTLDDDVGGEDGEEVLAAG